MPCDHVRTRLPMNNVFDPGAVRRAFARAAPHYSRYATLQREVEARLLEQLDAEQDAFKPRVVLDAGTGPGRAAAHLRQRYPRALVVALDHALPMLATARTRNRWWRPFRLLAGDAAQLPLRDAVVDVLFSSLCLQWQDDLPRVFDEWRRALAPGGMVLASTFGRDTLWELREAFSAADAGAPHINNFDDIARVGDALLAAGFRDPVLARETFVLEYPDVPTLMRELRGLGAGNALATRRRALTGKARMRRVFDAYETHRSATTNLLPGTWEVITLRALAPAAGTPRRAGHGVIASIPLADIPIRRKPPTPAV